MRTFERTEIICVDVLVPVVRVPSHGMAARASEASPCRNLHSVYASRYRGNGKQFVFSSKSSERKSE